MSFPQQTVFFQQGMGVPGDRFNDGPIRGETYVLDSALDSYNIIGATGFSVISQAVVNNVQVATAAAGNAGGTAVFAGILVNSKVYASFGTSVGGPLAATLTLANNTIGELATMGSYVVTLPAAADIGDLVVYDNTTGALSTIAPGADLPVGTSFAYAAVDYFTVAGAGLAVITLSPTLTIPQLA